MSTTTPTNNTTVSMGAPVDPVKTTKQGHSFLGCLCDMRRAVTMIDGLGLFLGISFLIVLIVMDKDKIEHIEHEYQEDGNNNSFYSFEALLGIQCAIIVAHLSAIIGAATFTICPILITILMDITYAVLSGMDKNWVGLGIYVFLLYPHVVLCYELAKGIMTRENYHSQERQSCCCV